MLKSYDSPKWVQDRWLSFWGIASVGPLRGGSWIQQETRSYLCGSIGGACTICDRVPYLLEWSWPDQSDQMVSSFFESIGRALASSSPHRHPSWPCTDCCCSAATPTWVQQWLLSSSCSNLVIKTRYFCFKFCFTSKLKITFNKVKLKNITVLVRLCFQLSFVD